MTNAFSFHYTYPKDGLLMIFQYLLDRWVEVVPLFFIEGILGYWGRGRKGKDLSM